MLNIAGPEYDFCHVVFAVLQECEHRRRGADPGNTEEQLIGWARAKLDEVHACYQEFGGSKSYWESLEKEVLETVLPQYIPAAVEMNRLERSGWSVLRKGDLGARILYAIFGLILGSILIAIPWIPIFEDMFAFAFTVGGFLYPDLKRYLYEHRHARLLNRIVLESQRYQENALIHYETTRAIQDSFQPEDAPRLRLAAKDDEPPDETTRGGGTTATQ